MKQNKPLGENGALPLLICWLSYFLDIKAKTNILWGHENWTDDSDSVGTIIKSRHYGERWKNAAKEVETKDKQVLIKVKGHGPIPTWWALPQTI